MPVSPARAAAFDVLLRVQREQAYASELLHSRHLDPLSPADRALAMEIVMGVLRWRSRLDEAIAARSFTPFRKLDLEVLIALRMGAYQIGFLERVPKHAAVDESVELAKRARKASAAPLVNAVLRKLPPAFATDAASAPAARPASTSVEELARACAHPLWLVERWAHAYGEAAAAAICAFDQQVPAATLRLPDASLEADLRAEGVELAPGALLRSARRVTAGDPTHTRACAAGRVYLQDEASQLVAALVGHGDCILDCCAAPGGKTAVLADRNPHAQIIAADLHEHRARLTRKLVRAANVRIVAADATALPLTDAFDRILADVPCSGTGTLARNPEIKWRLRPADLADLHVRQVAILRGALEHLAPAGRLLYSSCSLEKEENEDVVAEVVHGRPDVRLLDVAAELRALQAAGELAGDDPAALTRGAFLRTIPGVQPCDGFFAALMEKM